MKDYSEKDKIKIKAIKEIKGLLKNYKKGNIVFGKNEDYILNRINTTKEEVFIDLLLNEFLEFVEKQKKKNEIRYALFFIYSKRKGRVYIVKLGNNLRIITAYPIGRKTLIKYRKKRFIN